MTIKQVILLFAILLTAFTIDKQNIFGNYEGGRVKLTLNADSTFDFNYNLEFGAYVTCGHFTKKGENIFLTDLQDPKAIIYDVNCDTHTRTLLDTLLATKRNNSTVFNKDGQIILALKKNTLFWKDRKTTLQKIEKP